MKTKLKTIADIQQTGNMSFFEANTTINKTAGDGIDIYTPRETTIKARFVDGSECAFTGPDAQNKLIKFYNQIITIPCSK